MHRLFTGGSDKNQCSTKRFRPAAAARRRITLRRLVRETRISADKPDLAGVRDRGRGRLRRNPVRCPASTTIRPTMLGPRGRAGARARRVARTCCSACPQHKDERRLVRVGLENGVGRSRASARSRRHRRPSCISSRTCACASTPRTGTAASCAVTDVDNDRTLEVLAQN